MKKVLVVDDNEEIRKVMNLLLTHYGYKVSLAYSYESLLSMVKVEKPDFILLDVVLDNEDGKVICKKLKQNEETQDICIIIFSGFEDELKEYEIYNADWVMDKYCDITDLIEVLETLGKRGSEVHG